MDVAVATFVVALLGLVGTGGAIYYSRRAALASEEENRLLKAQMADEERARRPRVTLEVLGTRILGTNEAQTELALAFMAMNIAPAVDVLDEIAVTFWGRTEYATQEPRLRAHADYGVAPRLAPRELAPETPVTIEVKVWRPSVMPATLPPNEVRLACRNAGEVSVGFDL